MSTLTNVMLFCEGFKLFFSGSCVSRGQSDNQMFKNRGEQSTQRKARKRNVHLSSAPPRPLLYVALNTAVTHRSMALLLWQNQITHSSSIGTTHKCRDFEGKNVQETTDSFFLFFSSENWPQWVQWQTQNKMPSVRGIRSWNEPWA